MGGVQFFYLPHFFSGEIIHDVIEYNCKKTTHNVTERMICMNFFERLSRATVSSGAAGALGATIGGSVVAAVCAVGGSVLGPVGTFFGAELGSSAGAAIGGAIGSVIGCIGGACEDWDARG